MLQVHLCELPMSAIIKLFHVRQSLQYLPFSVDLLYPQLMKTLGGGGRGLDWSQQAVDWSVGEMLCLKLLPHCSSHLTNGPCDVEICMTLIV